MMSNSLACSLPDTDAAQVLGCTVSCVRAWRHRRCGPAFVRVGRLVRYLPEDLEKFLKERRVEPAAVGTRSAG